jgi:CRISPR/Cas system-associated exonuclease Cas4 (RecB family)
MNCISKTDYVLWRECPKNAWLKLHRADIYNATELTEFEQSVIDAGIETEDVARGLFPGGILIAGSKTDTRQKTLDLLITAKTQTLFQSVFEKDGLLAAIDVLQFDDATGAYALHEIKSSTRIEEQHLYDLAFQVMLLRKNGMKVSRACLVHLNPNYARQGELDLGRLFVSVDMTSRVDQISDTVTKELDEARAYLLSETEPKGPCSCIYKGRSRHCSTFQYSNPDVPEYAIHDVARIGNSPERLKQLVDAGVLTLEKVPSDIKLTDAQKTQVRVYCSGETVIDKKAIAREIGELSFPLHFIDYETYAPALPQFDRFSPYDHIPLQYSVHIVGSPGEEPIHLDFLHSGKDDPTASFLHSLKQHVGSFGTIVVWNKSFESLVNDRIAHRVPEARSYLAEVNDRMYDLKDIFAKQYFVHRDMLGKVSIKRVLPVLAPELSYSVLAIQNGATAALAWTHLLSGELSDKEAAELGGKLRAYCALDSYGMVAIWRALARLVEG